MTETHMLPSPCIFLIEDDPKTQTTLTQILTEAGYKVILARNGTEALTLVSEPGFAVDLILLDLVLPGIDGFDVLRILKRDKKMTAPTVVLSNLSGDTDRERALGLGAKTYLVKTAMSVEDILAHIQRVLGP